MLRQVKGSNPASFYAASSPPPGPPSPGVVRVPMEAPAADVEVRRGLVTATARRTAAMAEAERRLTRCGVVAVVVGFHPSIELAAI